MTIANPPAAAPDVPAGLGPRVSAELPPEAPTPPPPGDEQSRPPELLLPPAPRSHPLYLISAACMLLGCFVVQSAVIASQPLDVFNLGLAVFAYEASLAGAAMTLIHWPAGRNRSHLLALILLFFADPTFTYFRLQVTHPALGFSLIAAVGVATAGKLAWLARALQRRTVMLDDSPGATMPALRLPPAMLSMGAVAYLLTILMVYLPVLLNLNGWLAPGLYLLWWCAAGVLALALPNLWLPDHAALHRSPAQAFQLARRWRRYLFAIPAGFVAIRMGLVHWLYPLPFEACFLTPVLLVVALHAQLFFRPHQRLAVAALQLIAVIAALACSSLDDHLSIVALGWVAPWRVGLWFAAMLYAALAIRRIHWFPTALAGLFVLISALGATPSAAVHRCLGWLTWSSANAMPQSRLGWGVLVIGLAFFLLLSGVLWNLLSLRRTDPPGTQGPRQDAPRLEL